MKKDNLSAATRHPLFFISNSFLMSVMTFVRFRNIDNLFCKTIDGKSFLLIQKFQLSLNMKFHITNHSLPIRKIKLKAMFFSFWKKKKGKYIHKLGFSNLTNFFMHVTKPLFHPYIHQASSSKGLIFQR